MATQSSSFVAEISWWSDRDTIDVSHRLGPSLQTGFPRHMVPLGLGLLDDFPSLFAGLGLTNGFSDEGARNFSIVTVLSTTGGNFSPFRYRGRDIAGQSGVRISSNSAGSVSLA